jgi:quinoprotein glucose dehydrogenase
MNGFAIGPDGRVWGTIGDRGFNLTTKEGKKYDSRNRGAVFRFEPDGTNFEVVHFGLRNPKEIAFDDFGNGFSVDNNSDQGDAARVVYVV